MLNAPMRAAAAVLAASMTFAIAAEATSADRTPTGNEGCKRVNAPPPKKVRFPAPKQVLRPGDRPVAVVRTSCGTFRIALDARRAPLTANSFAFLAKRGFYDRLTFHRAVPGFIIQGGDPRGNGTGGPGYSVEEEPPASLTYSKGVVAMAKSSAEPSGRSGSQFFVMLATNHLPPEYALLGKVSAGMSVVERIGRLGTLSERPRHPVLIEKISLRRRSSGTAAAPVRPAGPPAASRAR